MYDDPEMTLIGASLAHGQQLAEQDYRAFVEAGQRTDCTAEEKKATAHVCDGYDRVCASPDEDLAALRECGFMSCCPDRKMIPVGGAA